MPAAGLHMAHRFGEPHGAGSRRSPLPYPKRRVEVPHGQAARARRAAAERRAVHRPLGVVPLTTTRAGPEAGRTPAGDPDGQAEGCGKPLSAESPGQPVLGPPSAK
jgi:hypothetical protein